MSETETATTAPASSAPPQAAPAAPVGSPQSQALSFDSMMSKMKSAAPASEPAPEPEPSAETEPEAQAAAPSSETEEQPQAATEPDTTAAPQTAEPPLDINPREYIKSSNLDPAVKQRLTDLAFKGLEAEKLGGMETVRQFRELGVDPKSLTERLSIHPSVEAAKRDAQLAAVHRQVIDDFKTNPLAMATKLQAVDPNSFAALADIIVQNARQVVPDSWAREQTQAFGLALQAAELQAKQAGDPELEEAARLFLSRYNFSQVPQGQSGAGGIQFNPQDPIHVQFQQMRQQQAQQQAQQQQSFEAYVRDTAANEIRNLIVNDPTVKAATGLDDKSRARLVEDIFNPVVGQILNNQNLMADLVGLMRSGAPSQELFQRVLGVVKANAINLIAMHRRPALEFWGSRAVKGAPAQAAAGAAKPPAPKPSSKQIAGAPTAPVAPDQKKALLEAGKAQGGGTDSILWMMQNAGKYRK